MCLTIMARIPPQFPLWKECFALGDFASGLRRSLFPIKKRYEQEPGDKTADMGFPGNSRALSHSKWIDPDHDVHDDPDHQKREHATRTQARAYGKQRTVESATRIAPIGAQSESSRGAHETGNGTRCANDWDGIAEEDDQMGGRSEPRSHDPEKHAALPTDTVGQRRAENRKPDNVDAQMHPAAMQESIGDRRKTVGRFSVKTCGAYRIGKKAPFSSSQLSALLDKSSVRTR
jgi:hypothetical protein